MKKLLISLEVLRGLIVSLLVVYALSTITGCALDQKTIAVVPQAKVIETTNVVGLEIKRPSDDGRFDLVSVFSQKFDAPLTVSRGPCHFGQDCLMWLSPDQGIQTKVIQKDWAVVLIEASTITIAK